MHTLSPEHVHTWRLSQHRLLERSAHQHWLDVVATLVGMQAQVMSAAEMALWARAHDVMPSDVEAALWRDRSLVKTWAMRGTLHLLRATDLPLFVAARQMHTVRRPPSWFTYHGVTAEELATIFAEVQATLQETPITREQLADAIAERAHNPKLRDLLRSGWGALLKPSAFQGDLCFGPSQEQNVTFVRPNDWLGAWQAHEPEPAIKEIMRRYLTAYGPATSDDFARWWGVEPNVAKRLLRLLADEIAVVDVEGWQGWALKSTIQRMQALDASHSVRLLPGFDPYTIALYRHPFVLHEAYKSRVSRPQGWISAVVLVNGRIEGVWSHDKQRAQVVVTVDMFASPSSDVKHGIEAEAQRLGQFWGVENVYTRVI